MNPSQAVEAIFFKLSIAQDIITLAVKCPAIFKDIQLHQLHGLVNDSQEAIHQFELWLSLQLQQYHQYLPAQKAQAQVLKDLPDMFEPSAVRLLTQVITFNDILNNLRGQSANKSQPQASQANDQSMEGSLYEAHNVLQLLSHGDLETLHEHQLNMQALLEQSQNAQVQAQSSAQSQCQFLTHALNQPINQLDNWNYHCRTLLLSPAEWARWLQQENIGTLVIDESLEKQFHAQGVFIAPLFRLLGGKLWVIDQASGYGGGIRQYQKKASDGAAIRHLINDVESMRWSQWLGLNISRCAPSMAAFAELPRESSSPSPSNNPRQVCITDALHLDNLTAWLPQAHYVSAMLERSLADIPPFAQARLWRDVLQWAIISQGGSTDYETIVNLRRLDLITQAIESLKKIEFIGELVELNQQNNSLALSICGDSGWQELFPKIWCADFSHLKSAQANLELVQVNLDLLGNPWLGNSLCRMLTSQTAEYTMASANTQSNSQPQLLNRLSIVSAEDLLHKLNQQQKHSFNLDEMQTTQQVFQNHAQTILAAMTAADKQQNIQAEDATELELNAYEWEQEYRSIIQHYAQKCPELFENTLVVLNPENEMHLQPQLLEHPPAYLSSLLAHVQSS